MHTLILGAGLCLKAERSKERKRGSAASASVECAYRTVRKGVLVALLLLSLVDTHPLGQRHGSEPPLSTPRPFPLTVLGADGEVCTRSQSSAFIASFTV